jgi:hypothetical protein
MSLGLLIVGVLEAGDLVGSLVPRMHTHVTSDPAKSPASGTPTISVCVCGWGSFLSVSPSETYYTSPFETYYTYKCSLLHYYTDRKEHVTLHKPQMHLTKHKS